MAACAAGCPVPVTWLKNDKTGRPAPVNQEIDPKGNVTCDWLAGTYHVLTKKEKEALDNPGMLDEPGPARFTLHFVTCTQSDAFRSCRTCHQARCVCRT